MEISFVGHVDFSNDVLIFLTSAAFEQFSYM
jgi:hypothetical protein